MLPSQGVMGQCMNQPQVTELSAPGGVRDATRWERGRLGKSKLDERLCLLNELLYISQGVLVVCS